MKYFKIIALNLILNTYTVALAKKTKTKIDDIVIGATKTPLMVILTLAGLGMALRYTPFLPEWIAPHIPTIFEILIALVAIYCTIKILSGLIGYYGVIRPSLKTIVPTLDKVMKFLAAFIGLMVILDILGVSVTAPLAALGIGGIAIAFALQSTLSDFLSGVYLMADRPIRVGDYIKLETGQEGYVLDIGWRSTKMRELPNNVIVVPNSKLAGAIITNYYLPQPEMSVLVQVGVSYDSDLKKVEKVTLMPPKKCCTRCLVGSKPSNHSYATTPSAISHKLHGHPASEGVRGQVSAHPRVHKRAAQGVQEGGHRDPIPDKDRLHEA
ncbi:MAG: mechanosensitive ion channel [Candidatus Hodarchaeaceae archaeon]|nr:mechanosensitive ion channel [Candidatus Hodarchaeaceae archaeon]